MQVLLNCASRELSLSRPLLLVAVVVLASPPFDALACLLGTPLWSGLQKIVQKIRMGNF